MSKPVPIRALLVASAIGGIGGSAVNLLAANLGVPELPEGIPIEAVDPSVQILAVEGRARVLSADGDWRPANPGDTLAGVEGFAIEGLQSSLTLARPTAWIRATHEARAFLDAFGLAPVIHLENGTLIIRAQRRVVTEIHGLEVQVAGTSYGVLVRPDRVVIAALEDEIEVELRGELRNRHAAGQEIVVTREGATAAPLPDRLTLSVERVSRQGDQGWMVRGSTNPNALLIASHQGGSEIVPIGKGGGFTTWILGETPGTGELIVYDAADRRAEAGRPSEALLDTIKAIGNSAMLGRNHASSAGSKTDPAEAKKPNKKRPGGGPALEWD